MAFAEIDFGEKAAFDEKGVITFGHHDPDTIKTGIAEDEFDVSLGKRGV
jgi:hypothetical protein